MHMRFLSRGFKNLQWYGMTKRVADFDRKSATLFISENRWYQRIFRFYYVSKASVE